MGMGGPSGYVLSQHSSNSKGEVSTIFLYSVLSYWFNKTKTNNINFGFQEQWHSNKRGKKLSLLHLTIAGNKKFSS